MDVSDLFLKTYAGDLEWLPQCIKHINHYVSGFRRLVVVAPPEISGPVRALLRSQDLLVQLEEPTDAREGYFFQQSVKLHAHNLTNATNICFMDTDCLACRPFNPDSFLVDGKPHFLYTPYSELEGSGAENWRPGTEKVTKRSVEFEYMRRHPAFYPRRVLIKFDRWIQATHGHAASQFMRKFGAELGLSEFNILGAWAHVHAQEEFTWLNTTTTKFPPDFVQQFWSYGGSDHPTQADRYKRVAL